MTSSFHVIGEIFDRVWAEGGTALTTNVQTTSVPPGGSTIVDFKVQVPGTYILVDHALLRAFNKGALGMLKVAGDENKIVYSGKEVDESYLAEKSPAATEALATPPASAEPAAASAHRGEATFLGTCSTCHQRDAKGLEGVFPPLAGSDFLMADKTRSIRVVLAGLNGPVQVNGKNYSGAMPPFANLTDHEIADVLTYVRSSFGNKGEAVTDAEVAAMRESLRQPAAAGHP